MTMTGLDVFDRTLQQTNIWLKDLMTEMGWEDRHRAYLALRATLQALRDRLMPDEAIHLGAQLPMLIRGFYFEGWKPSRTPSKERHKDEFLSHIRDQFKGDPDIDPEAVVRAVFKILSDRVSTGEISDIYLSLPNELRDFWPIEMVRPGAPSMKPEIEERI